ncbi:MAG: hypothetical protein SGBAC_009692 [Bacillariaceae sp.]
MAAAEDGSDSSIGSVELDADYFAVDSLQSYFEMAQAAVTLPVESIDVNQHPEESLRQRQNAGEVATIEPLNHNSFAVNLSDEAIVFDYGGEDDGSVPEYVTHVRIQEGTTQIAEQVFRDCNDLVSIDIPPIGLFFIGYMSFGSCWSLSSIQLPQTLNHIGPAAFHDCQSLTEISLPPGIRTISRYSFHDCSALQNVKLPATLNVICENAFAHCIQLESIELPEGLAEIQSECFRGCKSLVLVVLPATLEVTGENIFREAKLLQEKLGHSNDDMVRALTCRFSDLPLHQWCYSQVFQPITEESLQKFFHILGSGVAGLDSKHVDIFGMSIFHVLALSSLTTKVGLFQAIVERSEFQSRLLGQKDAFGKTALEYLCLKNTTDASESIRYILQQTISAQATCLGLVEWRERICHETRLCCAVEDFNRVVQLKRIQKVQESFRLYTTMEKISVLEQALWKANLIRYDDTQFMELNVVVLDREASRIQCGVDIVVPNVLSYI